MRIKFHLQVSDSDVILDSEDSDPRPRFHLSGSDSCLGSSGFVEERKLRNVDLELEESRATR